MHLMPHFWAIINSRFLLWRCRQCLWRRRSRCWMHFICFHFQVDICLFMPRKKNCVMFHSKKEKMPPHEEPSFLNPKLQRFLGNKTKMDYGKFYPRWQKCHGFRSVEARWKSLQAIDLPWFVPWCWVELARKECSLLSQSLPLPL